MSNIAVVLYSKVPGLLLEGIGALLEQTEDIQVTDICTDIPEVLSVAEQKKPHCLFWVIEKESDFDPRLMESLAHAHPGGKTIIVTSVLNRQLVQKVVQSGVQGLLSSHISPQELITSVYAVRGGHDYLSDSISAVLLEDYLQSLQGKKDPSESVADKLSEREIEVLRLWGSGRTNREIAATLYISVRTVESHKNHIMQKLNIKTTVELLKFAIRNGVISL